MSEGYLMKRILHLNQLPLEQRIEGRHIERLSCCTATVHVLNSLAVQAVPGGPWLPTFPKTVVNAPPFPVNSGFSLTLGPSSQYVQQYAGRAEAACLDNATDFGRFSP